MPVYVVKCENCGEIERASTVAARRDPCVCGLPVEIVYRPNGGRTFQDDIPGGMWVENLGPTPVKVYSHSERLNLAKQRGLQEFVRHTPTPGSSRSKWTSNMDTGGVIDPRPICMLRGEELLQRRREAAERLGVTVEELEAVSGPIQHDPGGRVEDTEDRTGGEFAERVVKEFNLGGSTEDALNIMEIINHGR